MLRTRFYKRRRRSRILDEKKEKEMGWKGREKCVREGGGKESKPSIPSSLEIRLHSFDPIIMSM